ncbi:MAG: bacillithiol biosynthesis cysteine-adding enzyme BshC [Lewinellaceae bacterium]|nr:bacillithiol biosynthesis cysteine-adding enzyme BshC [Lewinella sp.]MCB9278999.1 bacillithiol biosynthesis cysteine-adding enzyme BshC [Lewinellaceae bacterium]
MTIHPMPYGGIAQLSAKDIAYATADPRIRGFYQYEPNLAAFEDVIRERENHPVDRQVLVHALQAQYKDLEVSDSVSKNIQSLADAKTFTVVTAHQPVLFTGPLYYIYKIASAINLARTLNERYPDYHVVPVFVSGAEDHDFEEVNHTHLFGKSLKWESGESGPVGKMSTKTLAPVLDELAGILGDSPRAEAVMHLFREAYTRHETYGRAVIHLVNELFRDYGLVIADMSRPELKRQFIPIMRQELLEQPSQAFIEKAAAGLEAAGFSGQAHAREINLFYLGDQLRERFVLEDGVYKVLNTDLTFTQEQLLDELDNHPEKFSPNVIMRPLFQEVVLPNLAYIGGGGEIAYWLERKEQFAFFGVPYPTLVRRNSLLWVDSGSMKRIEKLGLNPEALFTETETLIKQYLADNTGNEFSLEEEKSELERLFAGIAQKTEAIDPTLVKTVLAEQAKNINSLAQIETRLIRAEKQRHEVSINQIRGLRDKLFPGGGLQERHDNFLPLYLKHGDEFLAYLVQNLNPLTDQFLIVTED